MKMGVRDLRITLLFEMVQPTLQEEPINAIISAACASRNQWSDGFVNRDSYIRL